LARGEPDFAAADSDAPIAAAADSRVPETQKTARIARFPDSRGTGYGQFGR